MKSVSLFLAPVLMSAGYAKAQKQPNIIILMADDLGWNDLSSEIATLGRLIYLFVIIPPIINQTLSFILTNLRFYVEFKRG